MSSLRILSAVRRIEGLVREEESAVNSLVLDSIKKFAVFENKLDSALNGLTDEEAGFVCGHILLLPPGSKADRLDVIFCRIIFETAIRCAVMKRIPSGMMEDVFYESFMKNAVGRMWNLVRKSHQTKDWYESNFFFTKPGMLLFNMKR